MTNRERIYKAHWDLDEYLGSLTDGARTHGMSEVFRFLVDDELITGAQFQQFKDMRETWLEMDRSTDRPTTVEVVAFETSCAELRAAIEPHTAVIIEYQTQERVGGHPRL